VKQSTSKVSLAFVSIVNGSEVVEVTEKFYNISEKCDQTTNVPHISLSNIFSLLKHNLANVLKVLPKDVANHCGATFHKVKIFLLEKVCRPHASKFFPSKSPFTPGQCTMEVFRDMLLLHGVMCITGIFYVVLLLQIYNCVF